ncbi:hypothetical protein MAR_022249, partial [Mya arenaria]
IKVSLPQCCECWSCWDMYVTMPDWKDPMVKVFDMLYFTETHLSNEVSDSIVKLNNFNTVYRKDVNNFSGWILIYVDNDQVSKRVTEFENAVSESIWIKLNDCVNRYLLCTLYRHPNTRVKFWDRFETSLERAIEIPYE